MTQSRRRESSDLSMLWIPAYAGMTGWGTFYETIKPRLSFIFYNMIWINYKFICDYSRSQAVGAG